MITAPAHKKVALVTHAEIPDLTDDDASLIEPLRSLGVDGVPAVWDCPDIIWHQFDLIVVRSPWNYTQNFFKFLQWLEMLKRERLPVANSVDTMTWNSNKRYLAELAQKGHRIIQSRIVENDGPALLQSILQEQDWNDAVFKPVVSAGAYLTHKTSLDTAAADQQFFDQALAHSAVIVQPFEEAICSEGEWSLIFFDGKFSHSVLKVPKLGDFRTQPRLGGEITPAVAPEQLVSDAVTLLRELPDPVLYARVDGVQKDGHLVLMELELIEPALFMFADVRAPQRFAECIRRRLREGK